MISRKAEPGEKFETTRYGIIGLAKRACFFRHVGFDVKVHDVRVSSGADESGGHHQGGRESGSCAITAGITISMKSIHSSVRLNSYGTTHLQIYGPVIISARSHWETEDNR